MPPVVAIDRCLDMSETFTRLPSPIWAIREIAAHVEDELREIAEGWDRLTGDERSELVRALAKDAPGVLQIICPSFGRFGAS